MRNGMGDRWDLCGRAQGHLRKVLRVGREHTETHPFAHTCTLAHARALNDARARAGMRAHAPRGSPKHRRARAGGGWAHVCGFLFKVACSCEPPPALEGALGVRHHRRCAAGDCAVSGRGPRPALGGAVGRTPSSCAMAAKTVSVGVRFGGREEEGTARLGRRGKDGGRGGGTDGGWGAWSLGSPIAQL